MRTNSQASAQHFSNMIDHVFTKLRFPAKKKKKVEAECVCHVEKFRKFQDTKIKNNFCSKNIRKKKYIN